MLNLNKVLFGGNAVADAEVKQTQSGTTITTFTLAANEKWTDKNTGEKKERAEFQRCTVFGKQAELAGQMVKKGSNLMVEGKIQTNTYTDQQGVQKYSTGITVDRFQMISSPRTDEPQSQVEMVQEVFGGNVVQ